MISKEFSSAGFAEAFPKAENPYLHSVRIGAEACLAFALAIGVGNAGNISRSFASALSFNDENNNVSALASTLASYPIRVDCNDKNIASLPAHEEQGIYYETLGFTRGVNLLFDYYIPPVIVLNEQTCETLTSFDSSFSPEQSITDNDQFIAATKYGSALLTLLHEIQHTAQIQDEAQATCYSWQKLPYALVKLGMHPETAGLVSEYSVAQQAESLSPAYLSEECAPGKAFDLNLASLFEK